MGAFFVAWLLASPALALCSLPGPRQAVEIASVIDGDTLRLADGRSVRLIGLDTPELGRKGRADEPYAVAARDELRTLVRASQGRLALHLGEQPQDRYGRALAHAFDAAGNNIEAALLRKGLGRFVAVAPNTAMVTCHQEAEARARASGRGMWRHPQRVDAGQIRQGGFALVEARIERIERNRGGTWLETDGPLVLNIPPGREKAFARAELDAMVGKRVEARGWIIDRKGARSAARWLLPISHPAMVSALSPEAQ
ncbi:thermonuclease family protein [Stutzerimonas tarimensis]|uniref:Thermonuclease family protein n=1 Tax=Stutzerimonas tarimensis TaxID=1507735 RepID=A0ABV7T511_9GAMM